MMRARLKFPMFSRISVFGGDQHPLHAGLVAAQPVAIGDVPFRERLKGDGVSPSNPVDVPWNFEKFLIGRDGQVIARFAPDVTADGPRWVEAIDAAPAA